MLTDEKLINYATEVLEYALFLITGGEKEEYDKEPNDEELNEEEKQEEKDLINKLKENSSVLNETKDKITCVYNNTLVTCNVMPIEDACRRCAFRQEVKERGVKHCMIRNERIARGVGFKYLICMNQLKNKILWGYHPNVFALTDNILDRIEH